MEEARQFLADVPIERQQCSALPGSFAAPGDLDALREQMVLRISRLREALSAADAMGNADTD